MKVFTVRDDKEVFVILILLLFPPKLGCRYYKDNA